MVIAFIIRVFKLCGFYWQNIVITQLGPDIPYEFWLFPRLHSPVKVETSNCGKGECDKAADGYQKKRNL